MRLTELEEEVVERKKESGYKKRKVLGHGAYSYIVQKYFPRAKSKR